MQDGSRVRPAAEARLPGLESMTGLLRAPSAYVPGRREVTLLASGSHRTMAGALLGFDERGEIGINSGGENGGGTGLNAKINLVPETLLLPAVSAGVLNAFGTSGANRSGYLVVSKYVIPYFVEALTGKRNLAVKLHAGYGGGLYRNQPFVGAEVWSGNGVAALGEVVAGRVNVGARYSHRGYGVTLGLLEGKRLGGSVSCTVTLQ